MKEKVENIKKVERETIVNYRNKYFNPNEIVLVAAGDVDESFIEFVFKEISSIV